MSELGGIDLVVAAMKRFPDNIQMQDKGCGTLRNMADLGANQKAIASFGGIDQILQAMDSYKDNESVVANAIGALRNLAFNCNVLNFVKSVFFILLTDGNELLICSRGGLKQILLAMEKHAKNDLVQEFSCETIWNFAKHRMCSLCWRQVLPADSSYHRGPS